MNEPKKLERGTELEVKFPGVESVVGTFIRGGQKVKILHKYDRDPRYYVCHFSGTMSTVCLPLSGLRTPYKEEYPVKRDEDPLESREFYERCQRYRTLQISSQDDVIDAWNDVKDFIQHHYERRGE